MELESLDIDRVKDQVVAKGDGLAQEQDLAAQGIPGGGELPLLIELAVIGQVGLWRQAQDPATVENDGAIEQLGVESQWRPHDQHRRQLLALLDQPRHGGLGSLQQRVLVKQVLIRVG